MLLPARTEAAAVARTDRTIRPLGIEPHTWLLIGITVVAAVLRFVDISSQSYWLDESQAVHEMHLSFGAMLHAWSSYEWNPPLYLLIAWPWAKVFGTGAVGLRSLSALLGVAVVPLIYMCGRELVTRRAGLMAAAFAAVNPFLIWYSQEAREYSLLLALCAASLLFFARSWHAPSTRNIVWWGVFSLLALLTQYFAGFLIAAEGVLLVYRARNRASVLCLAGLGVAVLALIPHVTPRLSNPAQFIVGVPLAQRIQQVPVTFGMSTLWQSNLVSWGLIGAAVLAAAVIALLLIGGDDRELRGAGLAAALAAVVLLVPLLLALLGHDDYLARGLMPAWIPLAIVIAAACTASSCPRSRRPAGRRPGRPVRLLGDPRQLRPAVPKARLARGRSRPGEPAVDPGDRGLRRRVRRRAALHLPARRAVVRPRPGRPERRAGVRLRSGHRRQPLPDAVAAAGGQACECAHGRRLPRGPGGSPHAVAAQPAGDRPARPARAQPGAAAAVGADPTAVRISSAS